MTELLVERTENKCVDGLAAYRGFLAGTNFRRLGDVLR